MFRRRFANDVDDHQEEEEEEEEEEVVVEENDIPNNSSSMNNDPMAVSIVMNELPVEPQWRSSSSSPQLLPSPTPYVSHTLPTNSYRNLILPTFPALNDKDNQPSLLLANVPRHKLNSEQLVRRKSGVHPFSYTFEKTQTHTVSACAMNQWDLTSRLINKYNVDEPVLDHTFGLFKKCYDMFIRQYCYYHLCSPEDLELHMKQQLYAYEFYVQVDVDLFYMKTCSFRDAKPRSEQEGLYCRDEPAVQYGVSPCHNCSLCVPMQHQSRLRFDPNQKIRFLNGYEVILNCPTDCQTHNIIYAMTCLCHNVEYVGESSQRLVDRLKYHRQHFNRIIHEFLIGDKNVIKVYATSKEKQEATNKDRMRLYRHAARCPSSIQLFLNHNPIYWCFIPVTLHKAIEHNRNYIVPNHLILHDYIHPTSIASRNRCDVQETDNKRSDEQVRTCMRQIPPPPSGYMFSIRQRVGQFQYFKSHSDTKIKPDESVDQFNLAIIAVLPPDAVDMVRRFVESLFIIHTGSELNRSGRFIPSDNEEDDDAIVFAYENIKDSEDTKEKCEVQKRDRGDWCRNVVVRYH